MSALNSIEGINYLFLESLCFDFNTLNLDPCLILVLLDNCTGIFTESLNFIDISGNFPSTPIIGVINSGSRCTDCLNCQKFAWGFVHTPINTDDIKLIISWYGKNHKTETCESSELYLKQISLLDLFIGKSSEASIVKNKISKIAPYNVTVLLQGETGSGKELSAKLIHYLSNRSKGAFVGFNCGTIPSELFENELFGHKKGAYTNAESSEKGIIAEAENGTLFLDEIESLPEAMQVKLLRFLEEKKYKPLGQSNYVSCDVRIIASANENLWNKVNNKEFREDLFYRLNIINIYLTPLRERQRDIPLLAAHFINRFSKLYNKNIAGIKPIAMMKMMHYKWEGNVRELENLLQEAVIMTSSGWIEEENLNFRKKLNENWNPVISFKSAKNNLVSDFEKTYLEKVLIAFNGNLTQAAKFAGKDRRAFIRLIKKYNFNVDAYRNSQMKTV